MDWLSIVLLVMAVIATIATVLVKYLEHHQK